MVQPMIAVSSGGESLLGLTVTGPEGKKIQAGKGEPALAEAGLLVFSTLLRASALTGSASPGESDQAEDPAATTANGALASGNSAGGLATPLVPGTQPAAENAAQPPQIQKPLVRMALQPALVASAKEVASEEPGAILETAPAEAKQPGGLPVAPQSELKPGSPIPLPAAHLTRFLAGHAPQVAQRETAAAEAESSLARAMPLPAELAGLQYARARGQGMRNPAEPATATAAQASDDPAGSALLLVHIAAAAGQGRPAAAQAPIPPFAASAEELDSSLQLLAKSSRIFDAERNGSPSGLAGRIRAQVLEGVLPRAAVTSGPERLTLQLEPAHLGKIAVHLQRSQGQLTITFAASNPEAETALRQGAHELVQSIISAGGGRWDDIQVRWEKQEQSDRDPRHGGRDEGRHPQQGSSRKDPRDQR